MELPIEQILPFIIGLIKDYPWFSSLIIFIGISHSIIKPLFDIIRVIVKATKSQKDDIILNKVENSKTLKMIMYFLDYMTGMKARK